MPFSDRAICCNWKVVELAACSGSRTLKFAVFDGKVGGRRFAFPPYSLVGLGVVAANAHGPESKKFLRSFSQKDRLLVFS
jgi:hypothetical protein